MSRLYFYVYPSAFQNPGGGEILLLKTKQYLEKYGVPVKLFDMWNDKFQQGDILHVFGSVKEALGLMETAKSKGVKIVHSPIIWYNWQSTLSIAYGFRDRALSILRQAAKSFFPQIHSARKKMMRLADAIIAGSAMEGDQIHRYFLIPRERIHTIYYGADPWYAQASPGLFTQKSGLKDFVLMAGRIEPRKNQLHLIRALKGSGIPLVLAGSAVSWHENYAQQCRAEADASMHFVGHLQPDSEELRSAFTACSVFALPSWFETPGLAALEAGLAGARLVITREGSTREYFREYASYANPGSISDIRKKIFAALEAPKTSGLQNFLKENFTWDLMALKTIRLYETLGLKRA